VLHGAAITFARLGLIEWLNQDHSKLYFRLLPVAILFLAAGFLLERSKLSNDSRYFYPFCRRSHLRSVERPRRRLRIASGLA